MPYKTGYWGEQAKARAKRRKEYFREYYKMKGPPKKVFRLGRFGELLAQQKLHGSELVNKTGYDLFWNRQRIEVKTSQKQGIDKYGRVHHKFDITTQQHEQDTDFFMILILEENTRELEYVYFIPAKAITAQKILTIYPQRSQYERFRLELRGNT